MVDGENRALGHKLNTTTQGSVFVQFCSKSSVNEKIHIKINQTDTIYIKCVINLKVLTREKSQKVSIFIVVVNRLRSPVFGTSVRTEEDENTRCRLYRHSSRMFNMGV